MSLLHFKYSSMNAGKSTSLLQTAHNHEEQQLRVQLFTSAIDDRYGYGCITSRIGPKRAATVYDEEYDFFKAIENSSPSPHCILVDEAQFLSAAQVKQLHRLAHLKGIEVMCFGLRTDAFGEPFPGSAHLLALADDIEEMKSVCACRNKATMNIRLNEDGSRSLSGEQISIGGNERYRQVCPRCFYSRFPIANAEKHK